MKTTEKLALLGGAIFGAGLMYLLDPDKGERRRALLRDQAVHLSNETDEAVEATVDDLSNRAQGLAAETSARWKDEPVSEQTLVQRVRAEMGHHVSHAAAIEVEANNGRVTLRGPILEHEVDRLISAVSALPSVKVVENQLEPHQEPEGVPGLQG